MAEAEAEEEPLRVLFVSTEARVVDAVGRAFGSGAGVPGVPGVAWRVGNVRDLPPDPALAFLSPANSLGFMDGGIDAAYSAMFEGVQDAVRDAIRRVGRRTALGRWYLPVGSAVAVPVAWKSFANGEGRSDPRPGIGTSSARGTTTATLISAPTMFLPHDVSGTRNAYRAMMAALMLAHKQGRRRVRTLVATGLCCGYGRMAPEESARQMRAALDDFRAGRTPAELPHALGAGFVLTDPREAEDEQPRNFDTREIHEREVPD